MIEPLRPLIVGNWKMHGASGSLAEARKVADALIAEPVRSRVAICPPATLIERMSRELKAGPVEVGGQDVHAERLGPYTGDIGADMLVDAGATLVIIGHSERRTAHCETDAMVAAKTEAAIGAGLHPLVCVGETLDERRAGRALEIITGQIRGSLPEVLRQAPFALAYEPIWAIGTGVIPTLEEIEEAHVTIRGALIDRLGPAGARAPILYGGSVKPENIHAIVDAAEVGGAIVGGASLKADTFLPIIRAAG